MEQSSARFISIAFALTVVTSAWLLFEASQQPIKHQNSTPNSNNQPALERPPQSEIGPTFTTYKCKGPNGTVYRDQVCPKGERELEVITSNVIPRHPDELATLREKAAQMESSRIARSASESRQRMQSEPATNNRSICDSIDKQIVQIDRQLRQPYQPSWGDHLKGERKKLNDQKFSSGC